MVIPGNMHHAFRLFNPVAECISVDMQGFVDALLLGIGEQAVQGLRRNVATDPFIE